MAQDTCQRPGLGSKRRHDIKHHLCAINTRSSTMSMKKLELLAGLVCFLVLIPADVQGQFPITPPPRINNRPQIANGRVYFLDHIPKHCRPPIIDTFPNGKLIKDNRAMMKADGPHIINGNIEIAPSGCLYIEPGSILKFAPGIGMIINGTLIARVSVIEYL